MAAIRASSPLAVRKHPLGFTPKKNSAAQGLLVQRCLLRFADVRNQPAAGGLAPKLVAVVAVLAQQLRQVVQKHLPVTVR